MDPAETPETGDSYDRRESREGETREERRARKEREKTDRRRRREEEAAAGGYTSRPSIGGGGEDDGTTSRGIGSGSAEGYYGSSSYAPPEQLQHPGAFPSDPSGGQYGVSGGEHSQGGGFGQPDMSGYNTQVQSPPLAYDQPGYDNSSYGGHPQPPLVQGEYPGYDSHAQIQPSTTPGYEPFPGNQSHPVSTGYGSTGHLPDSNNGGYTSPPGPPLQSPGYEAYNQNQMHPMSSGYGSNEHDLSRTQSEQQQSQFGYMGDRAPSNQAPYGQGYSGQASYSGSGYNDQRVPSYSSQSGQPYGGGPSYPQGQNTNNAQASGAMYHKSVVSQQGEVPRNPSTSNYNPKRDPAGPPPTASVPYTRLEQSGEQIYEVYQGQQTSKKSIFSNFTSSIHSAIHDIARDFTNASNIQGHHSQHQGSLCTNPNHFKSDNRFGSFATARRGNQAKWFVDGKDYCYAVSTAIERAQSSIWILDWWLSPELYLRRPGAYNEKYRLDQMLKAAAERGVKIKVIVYKEVEKALTLDSAHTKHALEALHPSIEVFRHPDHLIQGATIAQSLGNTLKGKVSIQGAVEGAFKLDDNITLYWAHHEKLCLIDGEIPGQGIAFMGGLDLCWGRWDLWHHPISDVHPDNVKETLFLGQDYNNARVMDFHTVEDYTQNKLSRTEYSRMGWSDVALCFTGPTVEDLKYHFVTRWNFIYNEKVHHPHAPIINDLRFVWDTLTHSIQYAARRQERYHIMRMSGSNYDLTSVGGVEDAVQQQATKVKGKVKKYVGKVRGDGAQEYEGRREERGNRGGYGDDRGIQNYGGQTESRGYGGFKGYMHKYPNVDPHLAFGDTSSSSSDEEQSRDPRVPHHRPHHYSSGNEQSSMQSGMQCQIVRSCSEWSNGTKTEHSVQNAYIEIINAAQHFVYIENQFFITITGPESGPVKNKIGEAIVSRIVRAHQNRQKFRMIVCMPSVPAFAGDLRDADSLGTRAIMEFQYNGICRGSKIKGSSIMERLASQGINPYDYIRFFNLRSYDRINISQELVQGEQQAGMKYEAAQQDLENKYGANWKTAETHGGELNTWQAQASEGVSKNGVSDSVAKCAMLGGGDVRDAVWTGNPEKEMDAFVSEELYIHTKLLIADDRIVICGSANLNDRSQLGDHDSEIAIIIEDPKPLASLMDHQPYSASHYAATLRRHIFRKHLGMLPAQTLSHVDENMQPIPEPNVYDFDSPEDDLVMDPLSDRFWDYWNQTAKINTDMYGKAFHCVPSDQVRNWKDYDAYFGKFFHKQGPKDVKELEKPAKYKWGHVVAEEFPPGMEGVKAVKETLARIRGNLVEMPMHFLEQEDIAKESLGLNAITEELYT